jgi:putative spermidine/putrescine transport system ATP-binding protein
MISADGATPIRLERCAKTFADGTAALEPLDLEVAAGETIVLLGPSGCGKTTTLRLIAGLESPDPGGHVFFGDSDVTHLPIERRNVGMVFQSYALFPNLDVRGNVAYGLRVRGVAAAERERRVEEMLAMMQMAPLAERRIEQLSGGQKQRVALARALAARPRALLLDEPLTALDAKLRDQLRLEINALLRRLGVTAIYVTHDQAEAMALGDRIVVMRKGAIAQVGSPREIYFAPASRFVAEFIGAANIVEASAADGFLALPGGRIEVANLTANGAVVAMIRPEAIGITRVADATLCGRVDSVSFVGDRQRLIVSEAAQNVLAIDAANTLEVKVGERIGLAIDPRAIRLLPGEAS